MMYALQKKSTMLGPPFHVQIQAILNGLPHISGGYDEHGKKLDSVCFLDTQTASWKQLPSMTVARCRHQMVAAGGALYAIGGLVSKVGGHHRRSSFMERYDPVQATWSMLPDPREPRYGFASAVRDNKIFIMGGLKLDGLRTTVVERYDVATGVWDVAAPMLTPRVRCASLCVGTAACLAVTALACRQVPS